MDYGILKSLAQTIRVNFMRLLIVFALAWLVGQASFAKGENLKRLNATPYGLNIETYEFIPNIPEVDGGAVERIGHRLIVVTGDGQFYQLIRSQNNDKLVSAKLPLESPMWNRDDFYSGGRGPGFKFRVTDLLIREVSQGIQLFVAHQIWEKEHGCFRMGVSSAILPTAQGKSPGGESAWRNIYQTQPCLKLPFSSVETGGRLAWRTSGEILMTVGDHGKDGRVSAALSQDLNGDYGKVLVLDLQGGAKILTFGHRNPQGLLIDKEGGVWVTEHGPAGGDELNLIVKGNNYGWPLATYGTEYNSMFWPLNPYDRHHGKYVEPIFAFVPSIAISNLIQLGGQQFPRWQDDFLVGSLRLKTLYRLHLRENRVIYATPIAGGKKIRDLTEDSEGRVVIWSDDESITVISRSVIANAGERAYEYCRRCHESVGEGKATAPSLKDIVGRRVADLADFPYSPALKAVGGTWTEERLAKFLTSPSTFAPGTSMGTFGVSDDLDLGALIEYLKQH